MMKTPVLLLITVLTSELLRADADVNECDSNPCLNGGSCKDGYNHYACECKAGYTGTNCESDIKECQNGGDCSDDSNEYTWFCKRGIIGMNCKLDINACESNPCQNGGHCCSGINIYTCFCKQGFTGTRCETDIDECESRPCQNGAVCSDDINGYTCRCIDGYSGPNCVTGDLDITNIQAQVVDLVCRRLKWHDLCSMIHHKFTNTDFLTLSKLEMKEYNGCAGLRLVSNSSSRKEGFLEVCRNGEWRTMCWDKFDEAMSNVVCRQLGFKLVSRLKFHTEKQRSTNMIMEELNCNGLETNLEQCKKIDDDTVHLCNSTGYQIYTYCY